MFWLLGCTLLSVSTDLLENLSIEMYAKLNFLFYVFSWSNIYMWIYFATTEWLWFYIYFLQRDNIIEIFYEKHLGQLIDVITASCPTEGIDQASGKSSGFGGRVENQNGVKPEILSNICELLCFCVLHHPFRIK